jgi:hypothetical protein
VGSIYGYMENMMNLGLFKVHKKVSEYAESIYGRIRGKYLIPYLENTLQESCHNLKET